MKLGNRGHLRPPETSSGGTRKKTLVLAALALLLGAGKVSAQARDTTSCRELLGVLDSKGLNIDSLEEHMDTWFGGSHTNDNESPKSTSTHHTPKRKVETAINNELAHNGSGRSINLKGLGENCGSNTPIDLEHNNHKTGKGLKLGDALPVATRYRLTAEEVRDWALALIATGLTDERESDIIEEMQIGTNEPDMVSK